MRWRSWWPAVPSLAWLVLVALKPSLREPTARATSGSAAPLGWLGLGAQLFALAVWLGAARLETVGPVEVGVMRAMALALAVGFWVVGLRVG